MSRGNTPLAAGEALLPKAEPGGTAQDTRSASLVARGTWTLPKADSFKKSREVNPSGDSF